MLKIPETAFLYCRVSTTDQKNSIENQEKILKEYCQKRDIIIKGVYVDFGKSGKNSTGRPEFSKLMDYIKTSPEPPVSMILCTKLDRFARSIVDLSINVSILAEHKIKFVTLQQEFNIDSPVGKLMFNLMGSFAEFERELIVERSREGFKAALEKGVICHRPKKDINKKKVLEYISKGLSASAIAKIYDVHTNTIKSRLNEWGYFFDDSYGGWRVRPKDQNSPEQPDK